MSSYASEKICSNDLNSKVRNNTYRSELEIATKEGPPTVFKDDIKYQTAHSCTIRQENGTHIIWILKIMLYYIALIWYCSNFYTFLYNVNFPKGTQTTVTVKKLDWLTQNTLEKPRIENDTKVVTHTDVSESQTFDVILGSDIVYERSLIKPLCEILKQNLRVASSAIAYIACTERSRTTLECFEVYLTIYTRTFCSSDNRLNL